MRRTALEGVEADSVDDDVHKSGSDLTINNRSLRARPLAE